MLLSNVPSLLEIAAAAAGKSASTVFQLLLLSSLPTHAMVCSKRLQRYRDQLIMLFPTLMLFYLLCIPPVAGEHVQGLQLAAAGQQLQSLSRDQSSTESIKEVHGYCSNACSPCHVLKAEHKHQYYCTIHVEYIKQYYCRLVDFMS